MTPEQTAAVGLGPLEAILAGSYGAANAQFFECRSPTPSRFARVTSADNPGEIGVLVVN